MLRPGSKEKQIFVFWKNLKQYEAQLIMLLKAYFSASYSSMYIIYVERSIKLAGTGPPPLPPCLILMQKDHYPAGEHGQ
jgi:hypothetical protein